MKTKTFPNGLVVKHRKSAIIFENEAGIPDKQVRFTYEFTKPDFERFVAHLEEIAREAWTSIAPKDATSAGSDYYEYYDKRYDNNGYLSLIGQTIKVEAPHGSVDTLYQFNKPKIQSFLYNLKENTHN